MLLIPCTLMSPPQKIKEGRAVLLICSGLLAVFAVLSYLAALSKSATVDETVHAPAGWMQVRFGDFRANPEHPPLWKYWTALPFLLHPIRDATSGELWPAILEDVGRE